MRSVKYLRIPDGSSFWISKTRMRLFLSLNRTFSGSSASLASLPNSLSGAVVGSGAGALTWVMVKEATNQSHKRVHRTEIDG